MVWIERSGSHYRPTRVAMVLVLSLALLVGAGSVAAQEEIDGCDSGYTISSNGEYVITQDIGAYYSDNSCIEVDLGGDVDVTIDGDGNTVTGLGGFQEHGIAMDVGSGGSSDIDVHVKNVHVTGGNVGIDILGNGDATYTLTDVTITDNGLDIDASFGDGALIADSLTLENGDGQFTVDFDSTNARINAVDEPGDLPAGVEGTGQYVEFEDTSTAFGGTDTLPTSVSDLAFHYDDDDVTDEGRLTIWRQHDGEWMALDGQTTVDTNANTATYTGQTDLVDMNDATFALVETVPAEFDVTITDTNSPVRTDETLEVDVEVTNVGGESDTQTIELDVNGQTNVDQTDVSLDGGESKDITLTFDPEAGDVNPEGQVDVRSDDDAGHAGVSIMFATFELAVEIEDGAGEPFTEATEVSVHENGNFVGGSTTDDGSETFDFTDGTYVVSADTDGYGTAEQTATIDGSAETVTLTMVRETGDVAGAVTDNNGDPVEGATVELEETGDSTTTDADGTYTIDDVPTDEYTLTVAAENFHLATESSVAVESDQTTTVDVQLEPESVSISGSVTAADTAESLDGVTVTAFPEGTQAEAGTMETGVDGTFELTVPGNTDYTLEADGDAIGYVTKAEAVSVAFEDHESIDFALDPQDGTISGTVTDAETGSGIAGVAVAVYDLAGDQETATTTGQDGTYDVTVSGNVEYDVETDGTGQGYDIVPSEDVEVGPGEDVTGIDTALDPQDGTVSGDVTLDVEAPEDLDVTVTLTDGDGVDRERVVAIQAGETTGSYEFTEVPRNDGDTDGGYTLSAETDEYDSASETVEVSPGADASVSPLALQANDGVLTGEVAFDVPSDETVTVTVEAGDGAYETTTEIEGDGAGPETYTLADVAAGETYTVTASAENYDAAETTHYVEPGATVDASTLTLEAKDGSISGTVALSEPSLHDDFEVSVVTEGGLSDTVTVDEGADSATYTIENVPAGETYTVEGSATDYDDGISSSTSVGPGEDVTGVDLTLDAHLGTIDGTVTDAVDGEPVADATVVAGLQDVDADVEHTGQTDENGEYAFSDVRVGTYDVSVETEDYESAATVATVEHAATSTTDVTVEPEDGTIGGTVTDATTGDGIENVDVAVHDAEGGQIDETTTGAGGSYQATVPGNGEYDVEIDGTALGYDQVTNADVDVGPGVDVTEVDAALSAQDGTISGDVTLDVEAAEDLDVTVTLTDGGEAEREALVSIDEGETTGSYAFTDVPRNDADTGGEYTVSAETENYESASEAVGVGPGADVPVSDLTLAAADGELLGQVVLDVAPTETVAVTVETADGGQETAVEFGAGETGPKPFTFEAMPAGESYTVTASVDDYASAETTHYVEPGETVSPAPLELEADDGTISGEITLSEPALHDGFDVIVTTESGLSHEVVVNEGESTASYTIESVPAGETYTVEASAEDYDGALSEPFSVGPGGVVGPVDLTLEANLGTIEGTVTDEFNGSAIDGATTTVVLQDVDADVERQTQTDGDGHYKFTDTRVGTYDVTVEADNYAPAATGATMERDTTATTDFELDGEPGVLTGTVTRDDGTPVEDAVVDIEGTSLSDTTDAAGEYVIEDVPRDDGYELSLTASGFENESLQDVDVGPGETVERNAELTGIVENADSGFTYPTIQNAVDEASDGQTIVVSAGEFDENVDVDENVTLLGAQAGIPGDHPARGENETAMTADGTQLVVTADGAAIDGISFKGNGAAESAVLVTGDGVRVANSTVAEFGQVSPEEPAPASPSMPPAAVVFDDANDGVLRNTAVDVTQIGVILMDANRTTVANNSLQNDDPVDHTQTVGIVLLESGNGTVSGNDLTDVDGAVGLVFATNATVAGNTVSQPQVTHPERFGILAEASDGVIVADNGITESGDAIELLATHNSTVAGNTVIESETGIVLSESSNNALPENTVRDSSEWDIVDDSPGTSANNSFERLHLDDETVSFLGENVTLRSTTSPGPAPAGHEALGSFIEVETAPDGWVDLTVEYTENDTGGIEEDTFGLWSYNATAEAWEPVSNSGVDEDERLVVGNVSDSRVFGVFAEKTPTPSTGSSGSSPAESDISVTDVTISDTTVAEGESVTLTATVENHGHTDGEYTARLGLDGDRVASEQVSLDAGAKQEVTLSHDFEEAGTYDLSISAYRATITVGPQDVDSAHNETESAGSDSTGGAVEPDETPATPDGSSGDDAPTDADGSLSVGVLVTAVAVLVVSVRVRRRD